MASARPRARAARCTKSSRSPSSDPRDEETHHAARALRAAANERTETRRAIHRVVRETPDVERDRRAFAENVSRSRGTPSSPTSRRGRARRTTRAARSADDDLGWRASGTTRARAVARGTREAKRRSRPPARRARKARKRRLIPRRQPVFAEASRRRPYRRRASRESDVSRSASVYLMRTPGPAFVGRGLVAEHPRGRASVRPRDVKQDWDDVPGRPRRSTSLSSEERAPRRRATPFRSVGSRVARRMCARSWALPTLPKAGTSHPYPRSRRE